MDRAEQVFYGIHSEPSLPALQVLDLRNQFGNEVRSTVMKPLANGDRSERK